ncbi:hypothetical protein NEUTE2DRAFT_119497, partial [Neurospora tetrasperma FGSC 2509]
ITATGCYQLRLRRELTLVIHHTDSARPNRSFTRRIQVDGRRWKDIFPNKCCKDRERSYAEHLPPMSGK